MNPERIAHFKLALEGIREALTDSGAEPLKPNRGEVAQGTDEDGQPLNEMLQAIASGRNKSRGLVLSQIKNALETINDYPDEFGLCRECEEPIGEGRLKLMPYAPLCVRCQSELEDGGQSRGRKGLTDYV